jgi:uncharacterized membrane protein
MDDSPNDNPWSSGAEASREASSEAPPSVADLVSTTVRHVMDDFVPWLVAGLPFLVMTFVGVFVGLFLVYGGMFAGMMVGAAADSEELAGVLLMAGLMVGTVVLVVGMTVASAPVSASMMRAVWQYLETGEKLSFGSGFSTIGQDVGRVVAYNLVMISAVLVGSLFCYVPGLLVAAALVFAFPAIVIHRLSIGAAIGLSVSHLQRNPGWHAAFFLLTVVLSMVLGYIPLIGYALLATIHPLFVLLAYRGVFGTGELPRGYEG